MNARIVSWLVILWTAGAGAEPASSRNKMFEELSKGLRPGQPVELKALEIRAKIYEPQVIYILDRSKVEVEFQEEEMTFLPRISEPLNKTNF